MSSSCSPARYARKYGRVYKDLDKLSMASIGYRELGKVKVDCRFRLSQTRWGVIGDDQHPVGIIYMDITVDQPPDCQLVNSIVTLTIDEVEPSPVTEDQSHSHRGFLQMTDHYGPKLLAGPETAIPITTTYKVLPELTILGSGAGGVGWDRTKNYTRTSRWTFTGDLLPSLEHNGIHRGTVYRTIKWELNANELDKATISHRAIQTAFAFEHARRKFYMRVEIQGHLRQAAHRAKERMKRLRFPSYPSRDQGVGVTVIAFDQTVEMTQRLDTVARRLPMDMERKNRLIMDSAHGTASSQTPSSATMEDTPPTSHSGHDDTPELNLENTPPTSHSEHEDTPEEIVSCAPDMELQCADDVLALRQISQFPILLLVVQILARMLELFPINLSKREVVRT